MLLKNCTANSWNCTITRAFTFVYTQGGLPYKPMALIERVPDNYFVWLYFFQIWSRFWRLLIRSDASGILVAGQIYITRIQRGNWLMGGVKLSALNLKKNKKCTEPVENTIHTPCWLLFAPTVYQLKLWLYLKLL